MRRACAIPSPEQIATVRAMREARATQLEIMRSIGLTRGIVERILARKGGYQGDAYVPLVIDRNSGRKRPKLPSGYACPVCTLRSPRGATVSWTRNYGHRCAHGEPCRGESAAHGDVCSQCEPSVSPTSKVGS